MDKQQIQACGDELFEAMVQRKALRPLTERFSEITLDDAYNISLRMLERRLDAGERIIGKKIGVTSKAVQNMLNVHQPDFGYLTDAMAFSKAKRCRSPRV
ncbi:2-hydroxypent-2,4-dienoate hydratase [Nitrincola nitratireducens]|uniref:2-hydroxypent-2,4-dienoate hydratase n=1 Tax=Nitrincola nitratireducens TaxID=1229521 RepID=W9V4Z4_9GAMM|nr:2-hydroxypent-2,4-dienoate hydratase [Nitrincola nitratireducens]